jgi:hypothetical protein
MFRVLKRGPKQIALTTKPTTTCQKLALVIDFPGSGLSTVTGRACTGSIVLGNMICVLDAGKSVLPHYLT